MQVLTPTIARLCSDARAAAERIATDPDDPEAVHDFRVALRRLRSLLRASRSLLGRKKTKALEQRIKHFGDCTGELRDAEVLGDTLELANLDDALKPAVDRWLQQRAEKAGAMRADAIALVTSKRLRKVLSATSKRVAKHSDNEISLTQFAHQSLASAQAGVTTLLPVAKEDVEQLHRLRIRFKRLRYTAEMLGGNWTPTPEAERLRAEFGSTQIAAIQQTRKEGAALQKRLGLLHDADQALALMGDASDLGDASAAVENALIELRDKLAQQSLDRLSQLPDEVLHGKPFGERDS